MDIYSSGTLLFLKAAGVTPVCALKILIKQETFVWRDTLLFIDKQLAFLEKYDIPATICLNKIDIGEAEKIKTIYESIGYNVI